MTGVPIFPAGIVKQYVSPIPFYESIDLSKCTFTKYKGSTKLRTEKFNNILLDPLLEKLKAWIEIQAKTILKMNLVWIMKNFSFQKVGSTSMVRVANRKFTIIPIPSLAEHTI